MSSLLTETDAEKLDGANAQRYTQQPEQPLPLTETDVEKLDGANAQRYNQQPEQPPPPPDGGYGWVCTVCVAFINANTWGINSSYGVFLAHYLSTNTFPGATYLDYAFVGGLSISIAMLISPLATATTRYYGTHVSLSIGIALQTASLIGASFASTIWQLFLSQGIAFGMGMGFLFVASVGIPPQWFTSKRSLANGISSSGSGFGGLLWSLAAGAMIRNIGLAWCFRVAGLVSFGVNVVCTILIRDRNSIIRSRQLAFDTNLLRRPEYLLLNAYGFFSVLGYIILIFTLANYANSIGLDAAQASVISAVLNLGQGLGRPPIGYFSDTIGRLNMATLSTFLCALLTFVVWIFATNYGVLIFFALVGGAVAGSFWACIGPVAAEVVGLQDVPSALNLEWLAIVLPATFGEPIALQIVQTSGEYLPTQLFVGLSYLVAGSCLVVIRGWKAGELDSLARRKGEHDGISPIRAESDADIAAARAESRTTMWKSVLVWRKV